MLGLYTDTLPLQWRRSARLARGDAMGILDTAYLELPEASIRYHVSNPPKGPGKSLPTLVIIPDPPILIEHYAALLELLRPYLKVVLLELPGFGFSLPTRRFRMTPEGSADVIRRCLEQLALGPYVINFPCVAGLSAFQIAQQNPDLIRGVIATQTSTLPSMLNWRRTVDAKGMLQIPVVSQLLLRAQRSRIVDAWVGVAAGHKDQVHGIRSLCQKGLAHGACYCLASALQTYLTPEFPELQRFDQPLLAIWGDRDRTHKHTDKAAVSQLSAHAELVHFAESGHFPDLEEPERFAQTVLDFMRQS